MKLITQISICLLLLFLFSCNNSDDDGLAIMAAEEPMIEEEVTESSMSVTIDGEVFETEIRGCAETMVNNINGVSSWGDAGFLSRHGFIYELSQDYEITFILHVFDTTQVYNSYSTELVRDYIESQKENIAFVIEVEKDNVVYRNQFHGPLVYLSDFLSRRIVDQEATLEIITQNPIANDCVDRWPQLPVSFLYSGMLENEDGTLQLFIDELDTQVYLMAL